MIKEVFFVDASRVSDPSFFTEHHQLQDLPPIGEQEFLGAGLMYKPSLSKGVGTNRLTSTVIQARG